MKVVRYSSLFFGILFSCLFSYGQVDQNLDRLRSVIPPSPNASSLAKYGEWPVSLYTGVPSIDIPIYTLKAKDLSLPIDLSYHASGIRVGEIASWVGLGWSLNAGGVVTRSVRGLPDEEGYFTSTQFYSNPDNLCSTTSPSNYSTQHRAAAAKGEMDSQQDIYTLAALGKSYRLLLKADGSVLTMPYSNIKINRTIQNNQVTWTVILEDGTRLYFGGSDCVETSVNPSFLDPFVSTWYLKSIVSANGETINFSYVSGGQLTENTHASEHDVIKYRLAQSVGNPIVETDKSRNNSGQTISSLNLASIESDLARVEFISSNSDRQDLKGGSSLSEIKVWSKFRAAYIEDYYFSYGYSECVAGNEELSGITDVSYIHKRLKLLSLQRKAGNLTPEKWSFEYNPQSLPSRRSYAQDYWGFFNGHTDNATLLPPVYYSIPSSVGTGLYTTGFMPGNHELGGIKDASEVSSQAEVLKKIIYPTGGSTQFDYEGNGYTSTKEFFDDVTSSVSLNLTSNTNPYQTYSDFIFTVTKPEYISLNFSSSISQSILGDFRNAYCKAEIYDGNDHLLFGFTTSGSQWFNLVSAGTYKLRVSTNVTHDLQDASTSVTANADIRYFPSLGVLGYKKLVGGLRIKSMTDFDGTSNNPSHEKYYLYENPLEINPVNEADFLTEQTEDVCPDPNGGGEPVQYHKTTRNISTKYSLGDIQGGTIGYGKVTELNGLNGIGGKTVSYFTNEPDNGVDLSKVFPYPPSESKSWRRGLLTTQEERNSSDVLLKELTNTYDFVYKFGLTNFTCGYSEIYCPDFCVNEFKACGLASVCYNISTEQVKQLNKVEKLYQFDGTNPLITTTNYFYDNVGNLQPTRIETTNSKNELIKIINRTPLEKADINNTTPLSVTASEAIDTLIQRNIISQTIQSEKWNGSALIYRSLTNFKNFSSTIDQPENVQIQFSTNPIETRVHFIGYDNKGNLIEQQKSNDVKHCYIFDYARNYPIAEIVNADSAEVAYSSFEFDGTGNWSFDGSSVVTGDAISGNKFFQLTTTNSVSKSNLSIGTTYLISYWSTNGPCNISGAGIDNTISGRYVNGWTYYQHAVTAASASITISGSGLIDELRLYPKGAEITTYTYDPLIGMTCSSDPNGEITYYEYDGFNRLKNIKDYQGNIIKNFQYNYRSSCGTNCFIYPMQTFTGNTTPGYPVGVFSIDNKLIGNANNQTEYISLWNSNTLNHTTGTLAQGSDALHFNLTLNANQQAPSIINGCRYYQFDINYNQIDGIRNGNGAYVDFGDGVSMKLGANRPDTNVVLPDQNTTMEFFPVTDPFNSHTTPYFIHNYNDNSLKTITIYHNDGNENPIFDNRHSPATSLTHVSNMRGNFPQYMTGVGGSSSQSGTFWTVANITNWNSINTVTVFSINTGDGGQTNCTNLNFAQDFMSNNKGLLYIFTSYGTLNPCYTDPTFKLSRLKSDWNTYFTNLQSIQINDDHWDREDLSALTQLNKVAIAAGTVEHTRGGTPVPIPSNVIDNIINQVSAGAGRYVSNGTINITSYGNARTSASDAAVSQLKSKGWTVSIDQVLQ